MIGAMTPNELEVAAEEIFETFQQEISYQIREDEDLIDVIDLLTDFLKDWKWELERAQ